MAYLKLNEKKRRKRVTVKKKMKKGIANWLNGVTAPGWFDSAHGKSKKSFTTEIEKDLSKKLQFSLGLQIGME